MVLVERLFVLKVLGAVRFAVAIPLLVRPQTPGGASMVSVQDARRSNKPSRFIRLSTHAGRSRCRDRLGRAQSHPRWYSG
jgi:hypothetical protein